MTQKSKKLKTFLTFTILAGLLFSCQVEEEFTNPNLEQRNGKIVHKSFEELIKETEFKSAFDKMNQLKKGSSQKKGTTSKTVMENRYDFTIADYPANVIVQNTETTYTFFITRDTIVNNIYENLIVKVKPNSEPTAHIIKYRKNAIANLVNGNFNQSSEIINLTKIIYDPSQYSSLVNTEQCETLHIWICNYNPKHDENTPGCTGESGGSVTLCTGSGGDGSTTSGNNYTSYGVPNYSSSTNSSGGSAGEAPPSTINTAPVGPPQILNEDPCQTLTPLLAQPKITDAIAFVKPKTLGKQEFGFAVSRTRVYDPATNTDLYPIDTQYVAGNNVGVRIPYSGTVAGGIHNHTINGGSIPSWGDINWLLSCENNNNNTNNGTAFNMIVAPDPQNPGQTITYAITIGNLQALQDQIDADMAIPAVVAIEGIDKKYEYFLDNQAEDFKNTDGNTAATEKKFLEYFNDYGVNLSKLDPLTNKWNSLNLTRPYDPKRPDTTNIAKLTPCN